MKRIKVLIADDHTIVRRGLVEVLSSEETVEVVGDVSDGDEAVEMAGLLKPDLILMDLRMPRCNGLEATRQILAEMPDTKILIFTVSDKAADLFSAIKAGARGYILKNEEPELLVQAIQYVAHGGTVVSPLMADKLREELNVEQPRGAEKEEPSMSSTEQEILRLLSQGATDKSIAVKLSTTEGLVKTHLSNILHKLRLANRRQAVAYAKRAELEPGGAQATARAMDTIELAEEEAESPRSPTPASEDSVAGGVELVIPPPVEPKGVLKLHLWLKEVANADIARITGTWGGDTVLKATIRRPILLSMLAGLAVVAELTEEPYEGSEDVRPGGRSTKLRRFRLVLQPE